MANEPVEEQGEGRHCKRSGQNRSQKKNPGGMIQHDDDGIGAGGGVAYPEDGHEENGDAHRQAQSPGLCSQDVPSDEAHQRGQKMPANDVFRLGNRRAPIFERNHGGGGEGRDKPKKMGPMRGITQQHDNDKAADKSEDGLSECERAWVMIVPWGLPKQGMFSVVQKNSPFPCNYGEFEAERLVLNDIL